VTHVLLWDIDGTLLTTARAGVFALEHAAREVCGVDADIQAMPTAGLTDAHIAAAIVAGCGGVADDATVQRFLRAYEAALPDRLGWRAGSALPGVRENLAAMDDRDDVLQLLLTGNTEAGAHAKLRHYGLDGYFHHGGAFCVDGSARANIAHRAVTLATNRLGADVDLSQTYVIGDTPHDIECGRAIGARTVAIAFTHPVDELAAHAPWLVLDGLPDPLGFQCALKMVAPVPVDGT
jgi:phosphoglycolate phosphatase-like HAD superfamily hydrolase